jgi:23S rRNA (uridine2552-2'-O)-methyltransferase
MPHYQPRDRFYRMARQKGLPSRAAFKLEELLARYHLVHPGARVLDLGCAPGGWLAVLAKAVGPKGRVVGIDRVACRSPAPFVITFIGEAKDEGLRQRAYQALGDCADLITCDMAPKLSGLRERDSEAMGELLELALKSATEILRPAGAFVGKVFMNPGLKRAVKRFEEFFSMTDLVRPRATRRGSSELYLVATDFHPIAANVLNDSE